MLFFFRDAARRFRSLRDGFVLRGLGNKKRECEKECARERERERNGVDRRLFAADCVPTEEERERERNTHLYKIVIAQNLRHTKETPFT